MLPTKDMLKYYAKRVSFGSCMPEYYLYTASMEYAAFWSVYHQGNLPKHIELCGSRGYATAWMERNGIADIEEVTK